MDLIVRIWRNKLGKNMLSKQCWVVLTQIWVKYDKPQCWVKNALYKMTVESESWVNI